MSIGAEQLPQNEDVALPRSLPLSSLHRSLHAIDPIAETELVAAGDKAEADVLDVQRSGIYVLDKTTRNSEDNSAPDRRSQYLHLMIMLNGYNKLILDS